MRRSEGEGILSDLIEGRAPGCARRVPRTGCRPRFGP